MKKTLILLSAAATLITSCEKVVNIDLNRSNEKYVIEAELFAGENAFRVTINKTTDYYGNNPQQKVNNAIVWLHTQTGDSVRVPFTNDGNYALASFNAVEGHTYQLRVVVDGKEFMAQSTMPYAVNLDTLVYEYKPADMATEGYELTMVFRDPAELKNYYRALVTVNDTFRNGIQDLLLGTDRESNGKMIQMSLFERFDKGDKISVELRGMAEPIYTYFNALDEVLNNQDGPAPTNPPGNFQNGALGYFGAFSSSKKTIIIN